MISYNGLKVYLGPEIPEKAMEWRNDKRIWKWCRQHTLLTIEQHLGWMRSLQTAPHKMFAIHDLITKKPVGACGLTDIDHMNQKAEFSLYICLLYTSPSPRD